MSSILVVTAGAALLLVLAGLAWTSGPTLKLLVTVGLALPQLPVPGLPEVVTVHAAWVWLSGLAVLGAQRAPRNRYTMLLLCLAVLLGLSSFWSPAPGGALVSAVRTSTVLLLLVVLVDGLRHDATTGVVRSLDVLLAPMLLQAVFVVVFRLRPAVEQVFWDSGVARALIGGERLAALRSTSPDNVLDPAKSGGVWLNANTASMAMGVAAMLFLVGFCLHRRRRHLLVALVLTLAVPFCGSKSGLAILLCLPVVIAAIRTAARGGHGRLALLLSLGGALSWTLAQRVSPPWSALAQPAQDSLDDRQLLLGTAWAAFKEHPFLGLGHGGFSDALRAHVGSALPDRLPPHNFVVAAWADAGLLAGVAVVALAVVVVRGLLRAGRRADATRVAWSWVYATAGWGWLLVHGLGDTTTVYGDVRSAVVPLLLLALLVVDEERREAAGVSAPSASRESRVSSSREPSPVMAGRR